MSRLLVLAVLLVAAGGASTVSLPSKEQILADATRAFEHYAGTVNGWEHPECGWKVRTEFGRMAMRVAQASM